MSKLKVDFQDAIDVIKLIIALLPLVKEILDVLNGWTENSSLANK